MQRAREFEISNSKSPSSEGVGERERASEEVVVDLALDKQILQRLPGETGKPGKATSDRGASMRDVASVRTSDLSGVTGVKNIK